MNEPQQGQRPISNTDKDRAVKSMAMEWAVRANCGQSYDDKGRQTIDPLSIVYAAIRFEAFIKGEIPKLPEVVTEVKIVNVESNQVKESKDAKW